jgi:hypothetical protein
MRDDLLDAQANVDWAKAQFDSLQRRLIAWREDAPYGFSEEFRPEMGKKIIRLCNVKLPPPIINAEVGFIVHAIRCSLDVLINALAERNGHPAPKDTRFPICASRDEFFHGKHAGRKAIKRLSAADQALIEDLEPWRGGNNPMLIALHDLDIMRKHRRLIAVTATPQLVMITSASRGRGIKFRSVWAGFENDAIVATTDPNENASDIQIAFDVTFNEVGAVSGKLVITTLDEFASLANSIIKRFDTP